MYHWPCTTVYKMLIKYDKNTMNNKVDYIHEVILSKTQIITAILYTQSLDITNKLRKLNKALALC